MFISFVMAKLLRQISLFPMRKELISSITFFIEMICFILLRLFGPKIKSARMISGILLFIGSLTLLFTSFGYGTVVCIIALCACVIVSIGNSSKPLGLILVPLMSPQFYIRLIINSTPYNVSIDINEIISNNYITLFIYPSILLLGCQKNSFRSK